LAKEENQKPPRRSRATTKASLRIAIIAKIAGIENQKAHRAGAVRLTFVTLRLSGLQRKMNGYAG